MKWARKEQRHKQKVLDLWSQHVEIVQTWLRAIDFGLRNKATELITRGFELWVQYVSDSSKLTGTATWAESWSSRERLEQGYIKAKLRGSATRLLLSCLGIWTQRMVRKKFMEDWTIHFYSRKRLDRIERQLAGQHLLNLKRLAFYTIGDFVQEKHKFQQQFGELRSRFACTSALVPASPLVPGESL